MKKSVLLLAAGILLLSSCNKAQAKKPVTQEKSVEQKVNLDVEKLGRVLSSMTDRCKEAIPKGNPEEFLSDLYRVLESEKDFSSEDLSPFYLIDKKHTVQASYEPKDLIHLESNSLYKVNKNSLNLRPEAYNALAKMAEAAKADGVTLTVSSTYRSYEYQKNLLESKNKSGNANVPNNPEDAIKNQNVNPDVKRNQQDSSDQVSNSPQKDL